MNNHTILAVNNAPSQLELLTSVLGEAGYRVLTAANGAEGLDTARRELPDLIISDVMMPVMGGIELCRRIRADHKLSSTPFLLVSAMRKDSSSIVEGFEAGADDYIEAPYEPMRLVAKATQLIERKLMEDALRESENRFRTIIENVTDIVSIIAVDGTIIYESPSVEIMLGYEPQELIGKNAFDFIHPEDRPEVLRYFNESLKNTEKAASKEYRFRHKNNSWQIIESVGKPFNDPEKGLVAVVNSRDITQRKKALEEKHESERRLRTIFATAAIGMGMVNSKWQCIQSNPALQKMLGYSAEELKQISFIDITHPDDVAKTQALAHEIIENNRPDYQIEKRYIKKSGEIVWVNLTVSSLPVSCGEEKFVVGMVKDITERKQAEATLRFQKTLLEAQSEASIDGILVVTPTGEIISHNHRFIEMWGISEDVLATKSDQITIKSILDKLVDPEEFLETVSYLYKNPFYREQVEILLKDGRTFERYSSPVIDADETHYGRVWFFRDITKRIKEETAVAEANQSAIREYDRLLQRLATLAQTSGAARDLTTVFRAILDFSRASVPCSALFISLYDHEQSVREGVYMWYNGSEMDVSDMMPIRVGEGPVGQAIRSGEVTIVNDYQKSAGKKPTHVYLGYEADSRDPRSTMIAPMEIKGNTVGTIEVQSYDLAAFTQEHATAMRMAANIAANAIENVRLFEQERTSAEQLRQSQKLESVGRLAGGIAHDFNNMLTAINGYSDLTLRRLKEDDPLRNNIQEIKKAGERSAALTHQLLAFSRQQMLKPKVLDLNQIVIEVGAMLKRLIGEDIQLVTSLASKLGQVEADPGQLTQVIMNLTVNARDAMPQGGEIMIETKNVYLDAEYAALHVPTQPGSYVMLAVSDTGTGIDANTQQHIFEPFFTTKETGKGTGLGLPTVYGIVKQSGGYIWFDSEVGVGTTFNIYLPRHDKEVESSEKESETEHIPAGKETILLVEDEELVRNLSRQILEDCGYQVIEASDGIEALSICRKSDFKIDLLITDIVMPKMSGRQLVEQVAALRPEIKVLYMSGYTDDAVIRQGVTKMDANFIQKPFTFSTFAQKAREVLDSKN